MAKIKLGNKKEEKKDKAEESLGDLNKILKWTRIGKTLVTEKCKKQFKENPEAFFVRYG